VTELKSAYIPSVDLLEGSGLVSDVSIVVEQCLLVKEVVSEGNFQRTGELVVASDCSLDLKLVSE
jgi:hypothetical protein